MCIYNTYITRLRVIGQPKEHKGCVRSRSRSSFYIILHGVYCLKDEIGLCVGRRHDYTANDDLQVDVKLDG